MRTTTLKGPCPADFWTSAEGTLQFDMTDGILPHVSLADDRRAVQGDAASQDRHELHCRRDRN